MSHRTARIGKRFTFEAAHVLPNVPADHPCGRVHGHTYTVEIELEGPVDSYNGWVLDFSDISYSWSLLNSKLDHRMLNDVAGLEVPTAENLAWWIVETLREPFGTKRFKYLRAVTVWEGKKSWAKVVV